MDIEVLFWLDFALEKQHFVKLRMGETPYGEMSVAETSSCATSFSEMTPCLTFALGHVLDLLLVQLLVPDVEPADNAGQRLLHLETAADLVLINKFKNNKL